MHFRGLELLLIPTVFHPNLYLTTETFLDFLLTTELKDKSSLELGCGSGAISLYLAKNKGVSAHVSDINPAAIDGVSYNSKKLNLNVEAHLSDLFENIPTQYYDILIINPPFFANAIQNVDEYAFNAGENFEYFKTLAQQLKARQNDIGITYMILTDKCDLQSILDHFLSVRFKVNMIYEKQSEGEKHLIYSICFA